MVHHHRAADVAHAVTGRDEAQAEIGILAIGGAVGLVEQRVAGQRAAEHQRGAGAVGDIAVEAVAALVRDRANSPTMPLSPFGRRKQPASCSRPFG